jgi:hypothetical protein
VRTAFLYQQLARHRSEIDSEIARTGEMSLREAVRFIAARSPSRSSSWGRKAAGIACRKKLNPRLSRAAASPRGPRQIWPRPCARRLRARCGARQ